jgi:hypothetical protein
MGNSSSYIGNKNAITYKEIFTLIKENKFWTGHRPFSVEMWFIADYMGKYEKTVDGVKLINVPTIWFTNLDVAKRHESLTLYKQYSPSEYPRYDNYDAINVEKKVEIPYDYNGAMGVPITFLDKYNPDQFEILWITKTWYGGVSKTYPEQTQINADSTTSTVTKLNDGATLEVDKPPSGKTYYTVDGKHYIQLYARIIIKRIGATQ